MSNTQRPDTAASRRAIQSDYEKIIANATLIWSKEGPSFDFDIDVETDDYETYQAFLSVIRPDTNGTLSRVPLMMAGLDDSEEKAMRDLSNILEDMVNRGVKKEVEPQRYEEFNMKNALKLINELQRR